MLELFDDVVDKGYVFAVRFSQKAEACRFLNYLESYANDNGISTGLINEFKRMADVFWSIAGDKLCFDVKYVGTRGFYLGWDQEDYFKSKGFDVINYQDLEERRSEGKVEDLSWILEHI